MDPAKGVEVTTDTKAHAIEKRHSHECAMCRLLDIENMNMKWHIYSESFSRDEEDSEICDDCLKDLASVRTRCSYKADNPNHDPFADFMPTFTKDMPNLKAVFTKLFS